MERVKLTKHNEDKYTLVALINEFEEDLTDSELIEIGTVFVGIGEKATGNVIRGHKVEDWDMQVTIDLEF